ncbi:metalloregulator ArsR/SmtB family transcription factor [Lysobacter sp. CFH 32150]|uniref:ArsR/SmtB family transcription factor n=1 Tax=Lysobacter sp. CFH 32150 TaxID=2927128 RepID=UPI001FA73D15|nr:metalloregulator ArsR/SmtB family transcription factor [Lysobacter sp. CFH 32150]MCI4566585.1 metalloregulator ArsR/SmtB family transcription factor [Lysobacter sp. CFH 32150]
MVNNQSQRLDDIFSALSDRTRRDMLRSLAAGERSVGELAAPFDMTLAAASKHIKVLEHAGLVRRTVQGRTHLCRLEAQPLHTGLEWLRYYEKFWNQRLDALDAALRAEDRITAAPAPKQKRKPR